MLILIPGLQGRFIKRSVMCVIIILVLAFFIDITTTEDGKHRRFKSGREWHLMVNNPLILPKFDVDFLVSSSFAIMNASILKRKRDDSQNGDGEAGEVPPAKVQRT